MDQLQTVSFNCFRQENVAAKIYRPLQVIAETENGKQLKVRTYQLIGNYELEDNRPSPHYLQVILSGNELLYDRDYITF